MNRRIRAALVGAPLFAALGGVTLASAHGIGHGAGGTVTQVSASSITVKLKNGTTVTDTLTGTTRVFKNGTASVSDLTPGTLVNLTLSAAGSTTVTAVRVEAAHTKTASSTTSTSTPRTHTGTWTGTHTPKTGTKPATSGTKPATTGTTKTHVNLHAGGSVVSATSSTVTVKNRAGQSVTYTLAGNAKLTKIVAGSLSDLKVGQTVSVATAKGSTTALSVFIAG
jgi:hypothetical protein